MTLEMHIWPWVTYGWFLLMMEGQMYIARMLYNATVSHEIF